MAKDTERDCVSLKKDEDEGYRKNKKGAGSYDSKKTDGDGRSGYPGKLRTTPGRYGSVKFD